jgi:photosynthetic reaction center H subunit
MSSNIRPTAPHPGAAVEPTGDPMKDGVGAAAWAEGRADRCDLTVHGDPRIQPMSVLEGWEVHPNDPDPRGMRVVAADGVTVGKVSDLWVDRAEPQLRYLAVGLEAGAEPVLLPMGFARVDHRRGTVKVQALMSKHFKSVPRQKAKDRITLLEEDRLVAYYAGGYRYADPSRSEPLF